MDALIRAWSDSCKLGIGPNSSVTATKSSVWIRNYLVALWCIKNAHLFGWSDILMEGDFFILFWSYYFQYLFCLLYYFSLGLWTKSPAALLRSKRPTFRLDCRHDEVSELIRAPCLTYMAAMTHHLEGFMRFWTVILCNCKINICKITYKSVNVK